MPLVGLGTWKGQPGQMRQAVEHALRVGYRHVDCAEYYGNEGEIGQVSVRERGLRWCLYPINAGLTCSRVRTCIDWGCVMVVVMVVVRRWTLSSCKLPYAARRCS